MNVLINAKGNVMKRKVFNVFVVLLILVFGMQTFMASSSKKTDTDRPVKTSEAEENLSDQQKVMQAESYSEALQWDDLDGEAEAYISGAYSKETLMFLLNTGRMLGYLDDFKAAGLVDQNYVSPYTSSKSASAKSSTTTNSNTQAIPESITTTKCDEKTMWAKSEVNVRENGSTSYKKVASLKKDEQVTVTGIDSTGWYEIRLADGTVGHVSDKYLTEVQSSVNTVSTDAEGKVPEETPTETVTPQRQSEIISIDGRTVVWYNAETGREEEVTFSDSTPLDEVEEFANTYLINGAELVESTPEPAVEPMNESEKTIEELESPIPSTEPEVEETQDPGEVVSEKNSSVSNFKYAVVGILVLVALASVTGIWVYKKKK